MDFDAKQMKKLTARIVELTKKEISLTALKKALELDDLSNTEVLGLLSDLRTKGINIITQKKNNDIYMINQGERESRDENTYKFNTDEEHEFRFVLISDTRFGSKFQQLSILNDIYTKAKEQGFNIVFHCGNLTEGLYSLTNSYFENLFLADSEDQIDYIVKNYPHVEGVKTYFLTGVKDDKHLKANKINIGKRISKLRDDMIYLGDGSCMINIDQVNMLINSSKLTKTYTVSYRIQQQIDSFRSEDKPEIFINGGLLQAEKFSYRNVECISVPSVCATTKEMRDKRHSNTVGAWYITVKTDKYGKLVSVTARDSIYYVTSKDDYLNPKIPTQNKRKKGNIQTNKNANVNDDANLEFVNRMYKRMKNNTPIEEFMMKYHINSKELKGILELCRMYGKNIEIINRDGEYYFYKEPPINHFKAKPSLNADELIETEIAIVSDTHFGNIHQQLHLLNEIYKEAYERGIDTVLHCGDIVDGFYTNRPEQPRQQFLHGFDEQANYVIDMYPKVEGITTKYILGSHDETHYKNGQATINNIIARCRDDMVFLGQDSAMIELGKVKIFMDHPGGGSAQALSYKLQKRIEVLESNYKPKIFLIGHYHKSYSFIYRNVRGILVPSLCDKTQFQQKQGLSNIVGAYFLKIYSDKKGNIQYFEPSEVIFKPSDMWDEAGKDKSKVKQLVIK